MIDRHNDNWVNYIDELTVLTCHSTSLHVDVSLTKGTGQEERSCHSCLLHGGINQGEPVSLAVFHRKHSIIDTIITKEYPCNIHVLAINEIGYHKVH